jgi:ABC-2 type transport system permease protein
MATPTTTTTSASTAVPIAGPEPRRRRSRFWLARTAFFAILRRDVAVTGRTFVQFLFQVALQPIFFLFIFGKVLPSLGQGVAGGFTSGFAELLLPGIVGLTTVTAALQGVTLPLVLDLGFAREIDDRLLAPLPVYLVAIEKILFAALRGLIAGALIFPLGYWVLGSSFQVRDDRIAILIGLMVLAAVAGASLGLTIGTVIKPEQVGLMFALIFAPLIFTGCTYYPWAALANIKWFQIVTLFNPLTYADEGLRYAMVKPPLSDVLRPLAMGWVLLALGVTIVLFTFAGIATFRRRVVS